jgi:sialic acid synthase SpsE
MTGITSVNLAGRLIGPGEPCYVIAEVGSNHDRDLDKARKLIALAAEAGVDAVKFQTFSGRDLYSTKAPQFDYLKGVTNRRPHELLDDIALPRQWQPHLADECRDHGVHFLSTPFDRSAVDELAALGVPALKIASFELVDLPLIRYAASTGRPLILSTGMATWAEIDEAIEAAEEGGAPAVCLLQCASIYPAAPSVMNLRAIQTMHSTFGVPSGLSDHTLGIHIPVAAVALGASLLEKHFTLSRDLPGPDHSFAIEPAELRAMVAHVRDVESSIGDGRKRGPSEPEAIEMYTKARRSIVAACDIPAGTRITEEMLAVKRPGFGIKPRFLAALIGRVARTDIEADDVVTWESV